MQTYSKGSIIVVPIKHQSPLPQIINKDVSNDVEILMQIPYSDITQCLFTKNTDPFFIEPGDVMEKLNKGIKPNDSLYEKGQSDLVTNFRVFDKQNKLYGLKLSDKIYKSDKGIQLDIVCQDGIDLKSKDKTGADLIDTSKPMSTGLLYIVNDKEYTRIVDEFHKSRQTPSNK